MKNQLVLATLATIAAAPLLRAQRDECDVPDGVRIHEPHYCEVREVRVAAPRAGPLSVDARPNGGVDVIGGDSTDVVVRAVIQTQAGSDADAKALAGAVRVITTSGPIHAEGPSTHGRAQWSVSFVVSVPRRTDLDVETENGGIRVDHVDGRMRLAAENGGIALHDLSGDVRARAENGPMRVSLAGSRWQGAGLDAETVNGPVILAIPAGYAAHLETGTVNGPTAIDIPLTVTGHVDLQHFSTDIGGGGPPIRVVTTNGPVSVHRE
jgi:DUF4097 and DUF4098 domain-containing protein YvlB